MFDPSDDVLVIAERGGKVWHLPGPNAQPLCGAELRGKLEYKYLPGTGEWGQEFCPACAAIIRRLHQPWHESPP